MALPRSFQLALLLFLARLVVPSLGKFLQHLILVLSFSHGKQKPFMSERHEHAFIFTGKTKHGFVFATHIL